MGRKLHQICWHMMAYIKNPPKNLVCCNIRERNPSKNPIYSFDISENII